MIILNAAQDREYKRAQTLNLCFIKYKKVIGSYPAFSEEANSFFESNSRLAALVSDKDVNGKGITTGKNVTKESFAAKCAAICTRTAAYAVKEGNTDLLNSVSRSHTTILRLKEGDVLGFVNRIVAVVTPLLTEPTFANYAVTSDMLDEVAELAMDFNSSIGKATLVNSGRSYASGTVNKIFKAIRANVKQFNRLLNFFEEESPAFAKDYLTAVTINDTGIRHNGIHGIITNATAGTPISGVTITGEGKNKTTVSSLEGDFRLTKIRTGLRQFTFTCPGYESQTVTVKLNRGKIEVCNISLQSQIITLSATA